jgi:hypothetical protein
MNKIKSNQINGSRMTKKLYAEIIILYYRKKLVYKFDEKNQHLLA